MLLPSEEHKKDKELSKAYRKMERYIIKMRGTFLHHFIYLEDTIDHIIINYFCEDEKRQRELSHKLVSSSMSFDTKQSIIGFILTTTYPDFLPEGTQLMETIEELQKMRNVLAHWTVISWDEFLVEFQEWETITFVEFSVNRQKMRWNEKEISPEDFEYHMTGIKYVNGILEDLKDLIIKERQQTK